MDAATETAVYERTIAIDASPETVWEFLVDPQKVMRWMGIDAELDPQPGGIYRVSVISANDTARGEFVEVDRPHRIVFTWGWDGNEALPPGSSTVEAELTPEGKGTSLRFVHRDLSPEQAASHATGWDHYLERLEIAAAGGDPGKDSWVTNPPTRM
jgi:uncharacterized protein YndB with AHSA1/START domain